MKWTFFGLGLSVLLLSACESQGLYLERVSMGEFDSSTKLKVYWDIPEDAKERVTVDHYVVTYKEVFGGEEKLVETEETAYLLEELKAGTMYEVAVMVCLDEQCQANLAFASASEKTAEEVWQIQGEGGSYAEAWKVVPFGSSLAQVARLKGDEIKMYYNGAAPEDWIGIHIAEAEDETVLKFIPTENGLAHPCKIQDQSSCAEGALFIAAAQAIPVQTKTAQFVRLFFEAMSADDGLTRNYYLDSQDGLEGEDFDLSEAELVLGEEQGFKNARQSKIALPVLDSQYWDTKDDLFMVITGEDLCGQTRDGLFYAQWDGQEWQVQKDEDGCIEPVVLSAHGPVLLHLGGENYKLYYEDTSDGKNKKPLRMIYTDGATFDDFEDAEAARDVRFLWPNGDELSAAEESGLGDHFIFLPTLDLSTQYMYLNLGGMDDDSPKEASNGIGVAVLLNP